MYAAPWTDRTVSPASVHLEGLGAPRQGLAEHPAGGVRRQPVDRVLADLGQRAGVGRSSSRSDRTPRRYRPRSAIRPEAAGSGPEGGGRVPPVLGLLLLLLAVPGQGVERLEPLVRHAPRKKLPGGPGVRAVMIRSSLKGWVGKKTLRDRNAPPASRPEHRGGAAAERTGGSLYPDDVKRRIGRKGYRTRGRTGRSNHTGSCHSTLSLSDGASSVGGSAFVTAAGVGEFASTLVDPCVRLIGNLNQERQGPRGRSWSSPSTARRHRPCTVGRR